MTRLLKKKQFRTAIAVLIAAVILLGIVPRAYLAYAETVYNLNIETGAALSGKVELSATSSAAGEALSFKVGDTAVASQASANTVTFHYKTNANTDNNMRAKNKLRIGSESSMPVSTGITGTPFSGDGETGMVIPATSLVSGTNYFRVIIGGFYGDNGVYDTSKPHGMAHQGGVVGDNVYLSSGNYDDFTIQGAYLSCPGGIDLTPTQLILHKGVAVGGTERVSEIVPYDAMTEYWLGDGWPGNNGYAPHNDAVAGHGTERLNIPFMIDFVFDYVKPASVAASTINTTQFADGEYNLSVMKGDTAVLTRSIVIDNTKPVIELNLSEGQTVQNGYVISAKITDATSGIKTSNATFNGNEVAFGVKSPDESFRLSFKADLLDYGIYNFVVTATDESGNTEYLFRRFYIGSGKNKDYGTVSFSGGNFTVNTLSSSDSVVFYEADRLDVTMGYGVNAQAQTDIYNSFNNYGEYYDYTVASGGEVALTTSLGNPYQSFEVNVGNTNGNVVITYDGGTIDGERFALKAYNKLKNDWVRIGGGEGREKISVTLNTVQYEINGKINLVAELDYVDNASDRMLWFSDPQYLTKFADLNYIYDRVMQYSAEEYLAGRSAYLVTTGDIVEDYYNSAAANVVDAQWKVAKKAFGYMDAAGAPYGIVTGNHDTGSNINTLDYSYYTQYFGEQYYNSNAWYGGSLNDNISHYDLVTVGGYDFLFLYLGYGVEGTPETITWANEVLKMYPHRNAIIATHAYLMGDGTEDTTSRFDTILNKIVIPNANVKFLLCGHNDGANLKKYNLGGGREFTVYLADYQFIENESWAVDHTMSDYKCNGEGYMREILIGENTLKMNTFSPVFGNSFQPYGVRDTVDMTMNYIIPSRTVTTYSVGAAVLGDVKAHTTTDDTEHTLTYSGSKAIIALVSDIDSAFAFTALFNLDLGTAPATPATVNTEYEIFKAYLSGIETYAAQLETNGVAPFSAYSFNKFKTALNEIKALGINANSTDKDIFSAFTKLKTVYAQLSDEQEVVPPTDDEKSGCGGCNSQAYGFGAAAVVLLLLGLALMLKRRKAIAQKSNINDNDSE